jgi:phage baseplate assembly protein V
MSVGALQNAMRLQAIRAAGSRHGILAGVVTSYDPNRYAAKCTLQPDDLKTGWLPVAAHWIGNGWGMFSPPSPGDQVNVEFIDGDIGAGTVTSRIWDQNNQPLPVQAGEWWLVHKSGQFIKLTNDGKLTLSDAHGATITLDGAGNLISQAAQWTHTGPVEFKSAVHFDDNVQVDKTLTANTDVIAAGISGKGHTHPGIQRGGSSTDPPT